MREYKIQMLDAYEKGVKLIIRQSLFDILRGRMRVIADWESDDGKSGHDEMPYFYHGDIIIFSFDGGKKQKNESINGTVCGHFDYPKKGELYWDRYTHRIEEADRDLAEKFIIVEKRI